MVINIMKKALPTLIQTLILTLFFALVPINQANTKPGIPEGFTWQRLREIKGKGLKPKGWNFDKKKNKGKIIYRITKDKKNRRYQTGLTINAVKNVSKRTNLNADLYAAYYIYEYMAGSMEVIDKWDEKKGVFTGYGCEVLKKIERVNSETVFRLKVIAVANKKTDTLYIIIFGSPEAEWESYTEIEQTLINNMILSERF